MRVLGKVQVRKLGWYLIIKVTIEAIAICDHITSLSIKHLRQDFVVYLYRGLFLFLGRVSTLESEFNLVGGNTFEYRKHLFRNTEVVNLILKFEMSRFLQVNLRYF